MADEAPLDDVINSREVTDEDDWRHRRALYGDPAVVEAIEKRIEGERLTYESLVERRLRRSRVIEWLPDRCSWPDVPEDDSRPTRMIGVHHDVLGLVVAVDSIQELFASPEMTAAAAREDQDWWAEVFAIAVGLKYRTNHLIGFDQDLFGRFHRPHVARFEGLPFSCYHAASRELCSDRVFPLIRYAMERNPDLARPDPFVRRTADWFWNVGGTIASALSEYREARWPYAPFDTDELVRLLRVEFDWLEPGVRGGAYPAEKDVWYFGRPPLGHPDWRPRADDADAEDEEEQGPSSEPVEDIPAGDVAAGDIAVVRHAIGRAGITAPPAEVKAMLKVLRHGVGMRESKFRSILKLLHRRGEYLGCHFR